MLRKLFGLLERRERTQLLALTLAMMVMGLAEMAGVASVLPFMQIVSDPAVLEQPGVLGRLYVRFGFESVESALFASGVLLLSVIAVNNALSAITIWLMNRFAGGVSHHLSVRLLARYLRQPYTFFLSRNTAELNRTLLAAVNVVVTGVMLPALQVAARGIAAVCIVLLLAISDIQLAILLGLVFGGAYGLVYLVVHRSQHRLGWEQFNHNGRRFRVAQEALAGIKDVKTLGREEEFLRRFIVPSRGFSLAAAHSKTVARIPRYALETVAFGGILVITLYTLRSGNDLRALLPTLGLYAFAGYRLMPALNELFASVVAMRFNSASLDELHTDLLGGLPEVAGERGQKDVVVTTPTGPFAGLEFAGVSFRYPETESDTLTDVSLRVEPLEVVGFVGATGSGKTTLVDLVLGLLEPTRGAVLVNGSRLGATEAARWRANCGYVPQDVFLSDDTITANIAFGIPEVEIDAVAVDRAAAMAQLYEFVEALPDKYETVIGERGVRISGGERQRIGIARALYHEPEVLVLDEATSALDTVTEAAILETIGKLAKRKTILMIAHRLSTVQGCDRIHLLQEGRIAISGTYDELFQQDARFRAMTGEREA